MKAFKVVADIIRWNANLDVLKSDTCTTVFSVPPNSDVENGYFKNAIITTSKDTGIDPRFILAVAMQESNGCVHVHSTVSNDGTTRNPGLMQDHDGDHTCNLAKDTNKERIATIKTAFPEVIWNTQNMLANCPEIMVTGMVMDGVKGTKAGDGLQQTLRQAMSGGGPVNHKRQADSSSATVPIPAELSACNAAVIAQFSNAVWENAVQYMQMAYSGSPLTPQNTSTDVAPSSAAAAPSTADATSSTLDAYGGASAFSTHYESEFPAASALSTLDAYGGASDYSTHYASEFPAAPTTFNTSVIAAGSIYPASESTDAATAIDTTETMTSTNIQTQIASSPSYGPASPASSAPPSSSSADTATSGSGDFSAASAQMYYRAARIYNSGRLPDPNALEDAASSTKCYVSDVANRLVGWNGKPATGCT